MAPNRVKVLFHLEKNEDGYPPAEVESLWGIRRSEGIELDNIPFFAKGVALGDVVTTMTSIDGALEFDSVSLRGGHSTYRILPPDEAGEPKKTMDELLARGLGVEEDAGLLAVDVPPGVPLEPIRDYFVERARNGRWEIEEAYRAGTKRGGEDQ